MIGVFQEFLKIQEYLKLFADIQKKVCDEQNRGHSSVFDIVLDMSLIQSSAGFRRGYLFGIDAKDHNVYEVMSFGGTFEIKENKISNIQQIRHTSFALLGETLHEMELSGQRANSTADEYLSSARESISSTVNRAQSVIHPDFNYQNAKKNTNLVRNCFTMD